MERISVTNAAGETCSLTPLQARYAEFLRQFYCSRKISPTVREAAKHFKVATNVAHQHLKRLEVKGLIKNNEGQHRGIVLLFDVSVPFCGQVSAGKLTWAEPQTEWLDLKPMFADGNFAAVVEDNTHKDQHILQGDIVIFDESQKAKWLFRCVGWKPARINFATSQMPNPPAALWSVTASHQGHQMAS